MLGYCEGEGGSKLLRAGCRAMQFFENVCNEFLAKKYYELFNRQRSYSSEKFEQIIVSVNL